MAVVTEVIITGFLMEIDHLGNRFLLAAPGLARINRCK